MLSALYNGVHIQIEYNEHIHYTYRKIQQTCTIHTGSHFGQLISCIHTFTLVCVAGGALSSFWQFMKYSLVAPQGILIQPLVLCSADCNTTFAFSMASMLGSCVMQKTSSWWTTTPQTYLFLMVHYFRV